MMPYFPTFKEDINLIVWRLPEVDNPSHQTLRFGSEFFERSAVCVVIPLFDQVDYFHVSVYATQLYSACCQSHYTRRRKWKFSTRKCFHQKTHHLMNIVWSNQCRNHKSLALSKMAKCLCHRFVRELDRDARAYKKKLVQWKWKMFNKLTELQRNTRKTRKTLETHRGFYDKHKTNQQRTMGKHWG